MSDDIVTRLRVNDCFEFPSCDDIKQEAADEIERLRAEIERYKFHAMDLWRALEVQKNMNFYTETAKGALDRFDKWVINERL